MTDLTFSQYMDFRIIESLIALGVFGALALAITFFTTVSGFLEQRKQRKIYYELLEMDRKPIQSRPSF